MVEDHTPLAQADDPFGEAARELGLVKAHHQRCLVMTLDLGDELQHILGPGGVDAGDRLIGQDDDRLLRDHPGDGDPLLLAAGESVAALVHLVAQADLTDGRPGDATILRRKHTEA